jgi:hypothetical protein
VDARRPTAQEGEEPLRAEITAIEPWRETNGWPRQHATVDKVQKQRAGLSALVDLGWPTGRQDWTQLARTPRGTQGAEDVLRPWMSWQAPRRRTRHPVHKAQSALGLQAVAEVCERHPCPRQRQPELLAGWKAWAAEHAKAFPRASAAVEGRNGALAQMQHNHRGLPLRRSQVWTARHHFAWRAVDGTTPASRFFRRAFADLFESVWSPSDELPRPRPRRQALVASH